MGDRSDTNAGGRGEQQRGHPVKVTQKGCGEIVRRRPASKPPNLGTPKPSGKR